MQLDPAIRDVYKKYGQAVVAQAKSLLISVKGLSGSSNLVRSINYKIVEGNTPKIIFTYASYGKYVISGRRAGSGKYKGGRTGTTLTDFVNNLKAKYKVDTSGGYAIAKSILKKGISKDIPPFNFIKEARKTVKFPIGEFRKAEIKALKNRLKQR